ncbi:MAG: hypothetical protein ACKVOU_00830 [Cytophagales bacterium]
MKHTILSSIVIFTIILWLTNCKSNTSSENTSEKTNVDSAKKIVDSTLSNAKAEETEAEESERIAKEKFEEDELAYKELGQYDGKYTLNTESEGADGNLEMQYSGERVFKFKLIIEAVDICAGNIEGEIFMDRTQHGIYRTDSCYLHFNFNGSYANAGLIIEIAQDDRCSSMKGDCIFSGNYTKKQ